MTIHFNNYAKKIGSRQVGNSEQDFYRWKIFADASDSELDNIDYIEYELHPSIPNSYRPIADRNSKFALKFNSWGEFTVRMTVVFKNGTKNNFVHHLNTENPFPPGQE